MNKVALITGAAKRIGATIANTLHQEGMNIVIHFNHSTEEANALCDKLNNIRPHSATTIQGEIGDPNECTKIINTAYNTWNRIDVLVNNASSFYPTKIGEVSNSEWEDLMGSNLKGPFFLSQAAAPFLKENEGSIINIVDIHAERPLKNYPVYCMAKAGLVMMTKALARELGPAIRVNGVAPGAILWPNQENALSEKTQHYIVEKTCLKRKGNPEDIAKTVLFLIKEDYITGQIIAVDGGRSIRD